MGVLDFGLTQGGGDNQTLFAMIMDTTYEVHGIYKSVNQGDSWEAITLRSEPNNVSGENYCHGILLYMLFQQMLHQGQNYLL